MTAPVIMTNCPSDETLAAFIDGRLEGATRDEVVAHLSSCSECRDVVNAMHEMQSEVPARRSWLIPAATLAAAAAIAVAVFLGPAGDGYRREKGIEKLIAASADLPERSIDARPSIDIAYKVYSPNRGKEDDAELSMLLAAAKLAAVAEKRETAANLHAAGVAYLMLGRQDDVKVAIQLLERAQTKMPAPNADLLNDLAAAYHHTGQEAKAKAAIDRAWELKKSPNIAWTRAAILDSEQSWKDYLGIDPNSEWSAKARENLDDLK